jgi:hypothetical protein
MVTGLAGCSFEQNANPESGGDGQGQNAAPGGDGGGDGSGDGGAGSGDSGDGGAGDADGGDGDSESPGDGTDGSPGGDGSSDFTVTSTEGPPTVTPGTTYSFVVENRMGPGDLRPVPNLPAETPATITIDVDAKYDDGEGDVFERTIELPQGETRPVEDAFTTEPDGPSYTIRTKLAEFEGDYMIVYDRHSAGHRFTPGGFGTPSTDRLEVVVTDVGSGSTFTPQVVLDISEGDLGAIRKEDYG